MLLKFIDFNHLFKKIKKENGSTFLLILMTFLPVLILLTYFGIQFRNTSNTFAEMRKDVQTYYAAQAGIERYKNQIVANHAYSDTMNFSKTIGTETYGIEVTSSRIGSGESEKIRIVSTVTGLNITAERTILLSRFP